MPDRNLAGRKKESKRFQTNSSRTGSQECCQRCLKLATIAKYKHVSASWPSSDTWHQSVPGKLAISPTLYLCPHTSTWGGTASVHLRTEAAPCSLPCGRAYGQQRVSRRDSPQLVRLTLAGPATFPIGMRKISYTTGEHTELLSLARLYRLYHLIRLAHDITQISKIRASTITFTSSCYYLFLTHTLLIDTSSNMSGDVPTPWILVLASDCLGLLWLQREGFRHQWMHPAEQSPRQRHRMLCIQPSHSNSHNRNGSDSLKVDPTLRSCSSPTIVVQLLWSDTQFIILSYASSNSLWAYTDIQNLQWQIQKIQCIEAQALALSDTFRRQVTMRLPAWLTYCLVFSVSNINCISNSQE